ncbi:MauE/DoxX family redox-associated membrane protein [Parapedobacter deserti]
MRDNRHIKTQKVAVEFTLYVVAIGFIVLLGFAGTDKVTNLTMFQDGLKNSPFIPAWAAWPVAITTVIAFYGIIILLLVGFWKAKIMEIGLWCKTALLLAFTLYVAAIMTKAPYRPCICIGLDEGLDLGWGAHLLLNVALLALAWLTTLLHNIYKILFAISEAPSQPLKTGNSKRKGGICNET